MLTFVDDDRAAFQSHFGFQHVPITFQWIAIQQNEVGQFARLQRSELIAHLDVSSSVRSLRALRIREHSACFPNSDRARRQSHEPDVPPL